MNIEKSNNSIFFQERFISVSLPDGRKRIVKHGHLPERKVVTGIGAIPVKVPRARDRRKSATEEEKIRFVSQLLPMYVGHHWGNP